MSTKTKTPVKPLRAQILDFLAGRAEATLKQIAAATSERDFPSRVTTELNKMRTDALVECEKKKGKNELWHWLASPSSAVPDSQPAVEQNAGSSAEDASATHASGAAVQPQSAPAAAASLSAAPAAADETDDGDEMPPADAALLALANRELADRLARVAHVLRGSGLEGLKDLDDGADLQTAAAALTGAYQMALAELHACTGKIADLQHKVSMQDAELFKQAGVVVDLRNQVEGLQRDAMRGATCLSGQDRYTAAGYLVRASKRKPRTLLSEDKAREAAMSLIRTGAPWAGVYALVPIGHARRGAEWRTA